MLTLVTVNSWQQPAWAAWAAVTSEASFVPSIHCFGRNMEAMEACVACPDEAAAPALRFLLDASGAVGARLDFLAAGPLAWAIAGVVPLAAAPGAVATLSGLRRAPDTPAASESRGDCQCTRQGRALSRHSPPALTLRNLASRYTLATRAKIVRR